MPPEKLLDFEAVAQKCGFSVRTARWYHNTASARRRDGTSQKGDMPPPDEVFGRSPVWYDETIEAWQAERPGRGAGGGRPRKNPPSK